MMMIIFLSEGQTRIVPEELLINSAATLNNLSYYANEESYLTSQSQEITLGKYITKISMHRFFFTLPLLFGHIFRYYYYFHSPLKISLFWLIRIL